MLAARLLGNGGGARIWIVQQVQVTR